MNLLLVLGSALWLGRPGHRKFTPLFIVLVMGFWKGRATALVLLASGTAAVVTHQTIGGAWHIVAGALAGLVAATALAIRGDGA